MYKTILRNILKKDEIDVDKIDVANPHNFVPKENIYFGAKVEIILSSTFIQKNEIHNFQIPGLDFYIELCFQIKKRFSFNDQAQNFRTYFNPMNVLRRNVKIYFK